VPGRSARVINQAQRPQGRSKSPDETLHEYKCCTLCYTCMMAHKARTLVGEDTILTVSMRMEGFGIGTRSAGQIETRISGASHLIFRFALGQATADRPDEFRFFYISRLWYTFPSFLGFFSKGVWEVPDRQIQISITIAQGG
jgi:hypothetical protein